MRVHPSTSQVRLWIEGGRAETIIAIATGVVAVAVVALTVVVLLTVVF